jgi:hypothetical protein
MRQNYYLMLKNILVSMCFIFVFQKSNAQQNVSISDLSTTPDASSVLDVSSTTKGLLIPRVALAATNTGTPITLPATSMLIYNTATAGLSPNNVIPGYYYNAGTPAAPNWLRVYAGSAAGTEWKLLGNSGTDANTNFLGTIDAVDLVFRTSNLQRARINSVGNMGIGVGPMGTAGQAILSLSRDGVNACCGGENSTLALGEATTTTGRRPSISFHASGESEGVVHITQEATGMGAIGVNRRLKFFDNQAQGLGLELTGNLWYGNGNSRTQTRANAGLRGDAGAQSGFYDFNQLSGNSQDYNYPSGVSGNTWWHLIDVRHSNPGNNYAMQLSGNFSDQDLYTRKTNDNPSQSWSRVVTSRDIVFSQDRNTYSQNNTNSGYRTTGAVTGNLSVKVGDVITIQHTSKFRWTGGSGGDHPFYGVRISGCANTNVRDVEKIGTADDVPRGQWQTIAGNYVWVSTCNGVVNFQLEVDNNSDADDSSEYRDIVLIVTRY